VLQLDLHHGLRRPRAARDAEFLGQSQRSGCGPELHEPDSMTI
jgi:hypothetical protein